MKMELKLLINLLLGLSLLANAEEDDSGECDRFCPEDLKAVVFSPKLKSRIDFLQRTVNAAIDGLETLHKKSSNLPDELKSQMGVKMDGEGGGPDDLRSLLNDLIGHLVRADTRAWNRVSDTNADIMDKSRAPKAPKSLSNLKTEIDGLTKSLKESEESFEPLLTELGSSLGKLLSPMMMIIEGMMKIGGGEMGVDKLKGMVDNLMGKVLLKMVTNKMAEDKDEKKPQPVLFGELIGLTEKLEKDFHVLGRKLNLPDFWKGELFRFGDEGVDHDKSTNEDDVLVGEDVDFITTLVEKYMS